MASWHTLALKELSHELGTNQKMGLDPQEAVRRLKHHGANKLPEEKGEPLIFIFIRQFISPLILVLFLSGGVLFILSHTLDALIISFVLLFNAALGTLHEGRAQHTLHALKTFTQTTARVIRAGHELIVPDTELVPGDLIVIAEGEKIPADARITLSNGLRIDESSLTGESVPVDKEEHALKNIHAPLQEQTNMMFKGCSVVGGNGKALVVKTGISTEIGKIGASITGIKREIPLHTELANLSRIILAISAVISVVLMILGLLSGLSLLNMIAVIATLAVSMIPEGLPVVITVILARGVWHMARRNALVKKLQAVEALGQAQVIAVDKTGTLTRNEMVVRSVYVNDAWFDVTGNGYSPTGTITRRDGAQFKAQTDDGIRTINRIATLTANASLARDEKTDSWIVRGDPTEAALVALGEKIGLPKFGIEQEVPRVSEIPFHYEKKYHATLHHGKDRYFINVAGAPEMILDHSSMVYRDKMIHPLSEKERHHLEEQMRSASTRGLRVICFAFFQDKGNSLSLLEHKHISKLTFVGFYCLEDSLRPEVTTAVASARAAGIRVVMLTGDHKTTAQAIATQASIYHEGDAILTGDDIDTMSTEEISLQLANTTICARVTPAHKLKIIQGYKLRNEIVAMTGDGVNDAPALVAADLGIGMGRIGTDVAKEASDIILLDDNFASIVAAIEEGRGIYQATRRVILFLMGTNIGEIILIGAAFLIGVPLPLLPAQIIWLNLVTDSFLDVSLGMEPKDKNLLSKTFAHTRQLVNRSMVMRMGTLALPAGFGALILFALTFENDIAKASTLTLTTIAIAQWFNALNCRREHESLFSINPFSNRYLLGALGIVIGLQLAAVYSPLLQTVLRTTPLTPGEWLLCIAIASSVIIAEEIRKYFSRMHVTRSAPSHG